MNPNCAFLSSTAVTSDSGRGQTSTFVSAKAPIANRRTQLHGARRSRSAVIQCCDTSGQTRIGRDKFVQLLCCAATAAFLPRQPVLADGELATYNGPLSLGFSFSYPSSWSVKKKPIKTHLSEVNVTSDTQSTTSAGLVVDAVKIDAIDNFGSPDVVGKKVVDLEMRKESVSAASVISADSIMEDDLLYYLIEYVVNSSRGEKHYLAKATVTGGQLYVFTAQASAADYNGATADSLQGMLESFSVKKQYL